MTRARSSSVRSTKGLSPTVLLTAIGLVTVIWVMLIPFPGLKSTTPNLEAVKPHIDDNDQSALAKETLAEHLPTPDESEATDRRAGSTTVVSAFFDLNKLGLKTKHEPSFYLSTGADGVLTFQAPCVFFTDSPEATWKAYRKAYKNAKMSPPDPTNFFVVNISLYGMDVAKAHMQRIIELMPRDREGVSYGYSGQLYTIYHAKPEMMRRAAELNPFKTERFLWVDVGAVRGWGGINATDYKFALFPNPEREHLLGRSGKIVMGGVAGEEGPCPDHVRWVDPESPGNVKDPPTKFKDPIEVTPTPVYWWIAGAIWGGRGDTMREYELLYRHHLARYLARDSTLSFSLIDQYMMGALACHSPMIEVVRPPLPCCYDRVNRRWFFMLLYLKDKAYPRTPYSIAEAKGETKSCKYCTLAQWKEPVELGGKCNCVS